MIDFDVTQLRWDKTTGLVPGIVQCQSSGKVLMLGYLSPESLQKSLQTETVTFFSRSRNQIWTKGETSGNFLKLTSISTDCDSDALLLRVEAAGPTCHKLTESCFGTTNRATFLEELEAIVQQRLNLDQDGNRAENHSYVSKLAKKGLDKVAQKVGEEAVETVIAAKNEDPESLNNEAADLVFHLLVLLRLKGSSLGNVIGILKARSEQRLSKAQS